MFDGEVKGKRTRRGNEGKKIWEDLQGKLKLRNVVSVKLRVR